MEMWDQARSGELRALEESRLLDLVGDENH